MRTWLQFYAKQFPYLFAYWVFFVVCWFFLDQPFWKIISGIQSECQTVWIQIRPDILSGLIWIKTVCKGYEQTTLVGKELTGPMSWTGSIFYHFDIWVFISQRDSSFEHPKHMFKLMGKNIITILRLTISLTHCLLGNFCCIFVICWSFWKSTFKKNSFRNTIRVSNSLDPDQAQRFVGPDLDKNYFQTLWADSTSRQHAQLSSGLEL